MIAENTEYRTCNQQRMDHFKFAKTKHVFMSERFDPDGRPGYGSGKIFNNYAYYSRQVESAPDPGRKALEYRSGSGKMADQVNGSSLIGGYIIRVPVPYIRKAVYGTYH
jgi:hypothetical protein